MTPEEINKALAEMEKRGKQYDQMRLIGQQMSNVMYNWSQCRNKKINMAEAEMMRQLYEQWDAIFK